MTQMRDTHIHFNHEFYLFSENVPTGIEELLSIVSELKLASMMCEVGTTTEENLSYNS
jgi:hypothetical protein